MVVIAEGLVTIRPNSRAAMERFVDEFEAVELPWLNRSGIAVLGAWKRFGGTANQMMNLYAFESLSAMQQAGQAQRDDPDVERIAGLYSWASHPAFAYRRQLRTPATFAEFDRSRELSAQPAATPRRFVELRRRIRFSQEGRAMELMKRDLAERESRGEMRVALTYSTIFGDYDEVTTIAVLNETEPVLAGALADSSVTEELSAILAQEHLHLLTPLRFSPLR